MQGDLFAGRAPYGGLPPSVSSSDTSREAAVSMSHVAHALRTKAYNYIVSHEGATCDEIENALNMRHQTASARVRELVLLGVIVNSGQRRKTRSGRSASVWIRKQTSVRPEDVCLGSTYDGDA